MAEFIEIGTGFTDTHVTGGLNLSSSPEIYKYFVNINNPASHDFTLGYAKVATEGYLWPGGSWVNGNVKIVVLKNLGGNQYQIVASTDWVEVSQGQQIHTFTGLDIEVNQGEYVGAITVIGSVYSDVSISGTTFENLGTRDYDSNSYETIFTTSGWYSADPAIYASGSYPSGGGEDPGFPGGGGNATDYCREHYDGGNIIVHKNEWWADGWAYINFDRWNSASVPLRVRLTVRLPWDQEITIDYEDETYREWTNPGDSSEHYRLWLNLSYFTGHPEEQGIDRIKECWWKGVAGIPPIYDNVYVCPGGSNNLKGWNPAYTKISDAVKPLKSGGICHIKQGFYTGESHLQPYRTARYKVYDHRYELNPGKVYATPGGSFSWVYGGSGNGRWTEAINGKTMIEFESYNRINRDGIVRYFDVGSSYGSGKRIKLKIFREVGSQFLFVGESPLITTGAGDWMTSRNRKWHMYLPAGDIPVQSGDRIGIYSPDTVMNIGTDSDYADPEANWYKSGDITTDTEISSWNQVDESNMMCRVRGFNYE